MALSIAAAELLEVAFVDLRIRDENGLELVAALRDLHPGIRIVVVSAYLSAAHAVAALRAGADDAVTKPVSASELLAHARRDARVGLDAGSMPIETASLARAQWEHMMRVLADCGGNISDAARRLRIHRQSLQRKLRKHAPP